MPRQSGQSTCESRSGSSTTTGVGHTAHSVERLRLTALRSWVKSHLSRKRWKVRTTSRKSEFGTANGGSTKSSANIIGARRNPCSLRVPRVPTRQRNGLQKSETMSANRTFDVSIVRHKVVSSMFSRSSIQPCLISPPNHSPLLPSADSCISATAIRLHCHAKYRLSAMSRGDGGVSDARNCKQSEYRHFLCAHNSCRHTKKVALMRRGSSPSGRYPKRWHGGSLKRLS